MLSILASPFVKIPDVADNASTVMMAVPNLDERGYVGLIYLHVSRKLDHVLCQSVSSGYLRICPGGVILYPCRGIIGKALDVLRQGTV